MESKQSILPAKKSATTFSPALAVIVGLLSGLLSLVLLYAAYSEAISAEDFLPVLSMGCLFGAVSFSFLSPWKQLNRLVAGVACLALGLWLLEQITTGGLNNDFGYWLWGIGLTIFGLSMCLDFFKMSLADLIPVGALGKVIQGTASAVADFGKFVKFILKAIGIGLLVWFAVWLLIAIGPLWLIVFLLVLVVLYLFLH